MFSTRQTGIAVGVFFLISHVTSLFSALVLLPPVLTDPDYLLGTSSDNGLLLGAIVEMLIALSVAGTAIALFPVVRRASEGFAIGYVALRLLEAGVILIGVTGLLVLSTLHASAVASGDPSTLLPAGIVATSVYNWAFLVGPGLICPVNTVVLAVVLYRSGLVPRFIPILGLVGAPLVFAFNIAKLFGIADQLPTFAAAGVLPLFAWEISLAIYLIAKGFRSVALVPAAGTRAVVVPS